MAGWEDSVVEVIKWVRDSNRPAWVLFIVSGAVLLLPHLWLAALGMTAWVASYQPWAVIVCALSLVWLATYPFIVWHGQYKLKKRIEYSGGDERTILAMFIQADSAVQCVGTFHAPYARSLIRDKIIFDTGDRDGVGSPYFAMDPDVFKYLKNHKELVGIKS